MTIELDEVKRREKGLKIINEKIKNDNVNSLVDLTGLAGGFDLTSDDMSLLETYAGPAVYDEKIQDLGLKHMGGEKVLPVNRTTSGIVATIIALVEPDTKIVHFLAKKPAHPSIPRTAKLVGAEYEEYTDMDDLKHIDDNTSLVIITGTTMDLEVIDEEDFKKVINEAHKYNIPVFVDDASGARIRCAIYNQPTAIDLGADLSVTSTDKLMEGPRGGLMAGSKDLIDQIKLVVNQYGLEAQTPLVVAMIKGLEKYTPERIQKAFTQKDKLYEMLENQGLNPQKTPTGFMFKEDEIVNELKKRGANIEYDTDIIATIYSMLLLKNYNIITIPSVGMPGASKTVRIDWSAKDSDKLTMEELIDAIDETFNMTKEVLDENKIEETLY
ncbi:TIGR03576 family pyridoxal phosphate-dependent enzyme [Methanosphaera cuniculi]|uniref:L-seryl-tRNA(Sec) selenium transferase n=1 Tax=Methanosphaera cuniculi TaxID=1077256 RepID=A0A2A2HB79_9EURY|nr:TIGR03576 family pyridoxal phosphate-dependent enzyme [Methanosphaera cuniculi]PAV06679.1 pyridoxal phosphate-dependent protein [Methanosphaera cuniculi]PWL08789.1 L-seryl-tRNA(Sec) selenium transferase [Methanosphaera cuniculi]